MQVKMKHLLGSCGLMLVLLSCAEAMAKVGTFPQDCTQIQNDSPKIASGVYFIMPVSVPHPFMVYCEMRSDGGWTVFQRRSGPQQSFNKNWKEYESGFGALTKDHWLGLEKVFYMTIHKSKKWTLRVELEDHTGGKVFAEYSNFYLEDSRTNYRLHVGKYNGNAGNAIRGAHPGIDQSGFGFSTFDRDNDGCSPCIFDGTAEWQCALSKGGGWWYSQCGSASLNGDWYNSGLHWLTWKQPAPYSIKATRMMIKSV